LCDLEGAAHERAASGIIGPIAARRKGLCGTGPQRL
jgi:hypothetical protein